MEFYVVDKTYISELQKIDGLVGKNEYGDGAMKFYLGIVLMVNDMNYFVPISSPKVKHYSMSDNTDFIKIHDLDTNELLCVLNINNMIPVPTKCLIKLRYDKLKNYRNFSSEIEYRNYVMLLQKELRSIQFNEEKIKEHASSTYRIKNNFPKSKISQRCCDFKRLEEVCMNWK